MNYEQWGTLKKWYSANYKTLPPEVDAVIEAILDAHESEDDYDDDEDDDEQGA